jgi:hypothetical protein
MLPLIVFVGQKNWVGHSNKSKIGGATVGSGMRLNDRVGSRVVTSFTKPGMAEVMPSIEVRPI